MSGRCGDKPTVTSFLQLFRLLTLYYPTKQILRGSNCDTEEERNEVLTSYTTNLNHNKKEMQKKKEYLKVVNERDVLGTQLIRRNDELALLYEKIKILQTTLSEGEK